MIYQKLFVVQNPTQRPKFSKESFMIRLKPIFGKFILKKLCLKFPCHFSGLNYWDNTIY